MNVPSYFKPFGPTIYSNTIDDTVFDTLNSVKYASKIVDVNVNHKLAGHLQSQLRLVLTDAQYDIFKNHIFEHVAVYLGADIDKVSDNYILSKHEMWINFQQSGEFNPTHHHSGSISGVVYLDVPPEIYAEKYETETGTTFNNFGEIAFYYGTSGNRYFYVMPQTRQILLFPAELDHGVFPFYSNVTRISIAFNLLINPATNTNSL
jgi:uncharacterized protein (TIGR02466 family)